MLEQQPPESDAQRREPNAARSTDLRLLTALIVVLVAIPSVLVFAPLGGAGTPAQMLGFLLFIVWVGRRVVDPRRATVARGLHLAVLVYFASVLASYIAAATRPIPPIEISAADRGMVSTLAWVGMLLFASDGPNSLRDLNVLLRRLSIAGGAVAALGVVQFATKQAFTNYIQIPGLSASADLQSVTARSALTRPAGTAIHPIEFGAVLTMILPIALHYALTDTHRRLLVRWFPVAAIAVAVPISISRSAIISAAIVLIIVIPTWARSVRRRSYLAMAGLACCLYVAVPGLIGTLTGLFTGISNDSSAASRTGSYSLAADFIARAPIFGRGFRTFLPSYRILDNQYLLSMIETGFVGLGAFLGLLTMSIVTSARVRRRSSNDTTRSLAHALTASVAAAACSFALYDAFSFPMAASLLFIIIGSAGALLRVTGDRLLAT